MFAEQVPKGAAARPNSAAETPPKTRLDRVSVALPELVITALPQAEDPTTAVIDSELAEMPKAGVGAAAIPLSGTSRGAGAGSAPEPTKVRLSDVARPPAAPALAVNCSVSVQAPPAGTTFVGHVSPTTAKSATSPPLKTAA